MCFPLSLVIFDTDWVLLIMAHKSIFSTLIIEKNIIIHVYRVCYTKHFVISLIL